MAHDTPPHSHDPPPAPAARTHAAPDELQSAGLFRGLDPTALARLAAIAERVAIPAGETVFRQGDPATAFYVLIRGQVKVFKLLRDGRTATLRYARPGDTFAESALTVDRYPAHTETTAPSVVFRFPVAQFRGLMLEQPQFALEMLGRTTQLMSLLNRRIEELLLPVPARLARFLLELCDEQLLRGTCPAAHASVAPSVHPDTAPSALPSASEPGRRADPHSTSLAAADPGRAPLTGPRICRLPMTKRDLAARLGTVPETLSRAFTSLKRARVIHMAGNGELVEVLDFEALARIAQY